MRRLGLLLPALLACTPGTGGSSSEVDLETMSSGTTGTTNPGVQTVTGDTEHTDSGVTDPVTTTTGVTSESSSTSDPTSGSEDASTTPVDAVCGNGVVEGDELCDDANDDEGDECTTKCRPPECGDFILHIGEQCDDGNKSDNDACLNDCTPAACGDGKLYQDMEECDDANKVDTDDCLSNCKAAKCGDNVIWDGEEACDDGFNEGDYNGCAPGCKTLSDIRCGDGVVQEQYEHCDGDTKLMGVGCKQCLFDFSAVPQMSCSKTCSWAGAAGCDQEDANVYCKLRTGNKQSTATSFKLAAPTDAGGFPCSNPNAFLDPDLRKLLGLLTEFGVLKPVYYQETMIATTHGTAQVIQGSSLVCSP